MSDNDTSNVSEKISGARSLAWRLWVQGTDPGATQPRSVGLEKRNSIDDAYRAFVAGYNAAHTQVLKPLLKAFEPPDDPEDKPPDSCTT
jgi:hypothetical protein